MDERQVTVDGSTYPLELPFMVIATQNPVEMEGTYPLPEAQRDRFTARISIGYPDKEAEFEMLETHGSSSPLDDLQGLAGPVLAHRLLPTPEAMVERELPERVLTRLIERLPLPLK